MDNKTILELIKKNLEEINLLVDDLYKGGNYNQLLIEITSAKTNILHQELMLLTPTDTSPSVHDYFELVAEPIVHNDIRKEPIVDEDKESEITEEKVTQQIEEPVDESQIANEELAVDIEEPTVIDQTEDVIPEPDLIDEPTAELLSDELQTIVEEQPEEKVEEMTDIENNEVSASEIEETSEIAAEVAAEESVVADVVEEVSSVADDAAIENEVPVVEPTDIVLEKNEKKVFGEQFSKEPSLHDKLSEAAHVSSRIKGMPITNLRSAIGLNDRFMFTRELFGNDSGKFDLTVDTIDQLSTFLEAIEHLEQNYKWTKNETSLKFMDLVKRRFEK